jgi:FkbH-like protein
MLPAFFEYIVKKYFKVYTLTDEDKKKNEQYKAISNRIQAQKSFSDFNKFLESLEIRLSIERANEFNIPRIAQMTQKTNQFNLTTKRYTDADIKKMLAEGALIWCVSVADKFGDNGITGCVIVCGSEIDTFLLSCRILGKGIEIAFANTIFGILKDMGSNVITAKYIPTAKNMQVSDFYDKKCGMTLVSENNNGEKNYKLSLIETNFSTSNIYKISIK